MQLNFSDTLPPGARLVGDPVVSRGINKAQVEAELRAAPGKWALVYSSTYAKTATDWRKRDGIEVATEALPNQDGVNSGSKKVKVWLRYVGVEDGSLAGQGLPVQSDPPQSPEAESLPTNPQADQLPPAPLATPPAPLATPPAFVPGAPKTAFQKSYEESQGNSGVIV